jgi:hypothetical protein
VFRGTLSAAIAYWQATPPRGEFVIVLMPNSDAP